jgi:adiponectin receptor
MGAIYISGAILFMTRFPECVWPEKFNLCFQSHQLFHVFVVAAALLQFYAVFNLQQTRKSLGNHCAGSDVLENSQNE